MTQALSLAALTVLEVGPIEQVRIARACGYSHVGLRPLPATPDEPHVPILAQGPHRRALLEVLDGEGIGVLDCEIIRLAPVIDWPEVERVIEFSAAFAARRLLVADNDPDPQRSAASLARLAELALPVGVIPCLEFMPWTFAPNLAEARQRISGIAGAALLIDAFHFARSGGTVAELAQAIPDVSYLQFCDIAGPIPPIDEILREARSDRLFPGDGKIDLVSLRRLLPDRPISLEVPNDRLRDAGVPARERATLAIEKCRLVLARSSNGL